MIMSIVPQASAIASETLLICLLASLLVIEMLPDAGIEPGVIATALHKPELYARSYVVVTAKSAGLNALINLVFLIAMASETPFLWCYLYFFLAFIPFVGPFIALAPPIFLALLMLGWKKALLVGCVLIVTQMIVGNVVMPILAKKAMSISFLEFTLSLVGWTFLLGLPGAIAAIPLTLRFEGVHRKAPGTACAHRTNTSLRFGDPLQAMNRKFEGNSGVSSSIRMGFRGAFWWMISLWEKNIQVNSN